MSEAGKKRTETSPEVPEKATRRRFTRAYKEQILASLNLRYFLLWPLAADHRPTLAAA
jgi:hypothetical protein